MAQRSRSRWVFGVVLLSIFGNSLLFVLKLWVGLKTHSLALQADAWHTISDTLSSLVVLAGVYIAKRPPDREHPFGHGRYELLTTLLVGVLLVWVAGTFFYKGIELLLERQSATFGVAAVVVTVIGILVKEVMARLTFAVARRSGNTALHADGWHHRSDALSSIVVLAGVLVGRWFWWMDGFLSLVVALMIGYVAWHTIRRAASTLVGEAPSPSLQQAIKETVARAAAPLDVTPHDFRLHNYIQNQELTLHIVLSDEMTVGESFEITSRIEHALREELSLNATVHIEPRSHVEKEPPRH